MNKLDRFLLLMIITTIINVGLIVSCTAKPPDPPAPVETESDLCDYHDIGTFDGLYICTLPDGATCTIYTGIDKGGIDCDYDQ